MDGNGNCVEDCDVPPSFYAAEWFSCLRMHAVCDVNNDGFCDGDDWYGVVWNEILQNTDTTCRDPNYVLRYPDRYNVWFPPALWTCDMWDYWQVSWVDIVEMTKLAIGVYCWAGTCPIVNDVDGDGYAGDDCVPDDPDIYPWAIEICDGIDNDCDLLVDEWVCVVRYQCNSDWSSAIVWVNQWWNEIESWVPCGPNDLTYDANEYYTSMTTVCLPGGTIPDDNTCRYPYLCSDSPDPLWTRSVSRPWQPWVCSDFYTPELYDGTILYSNDDIVCENLNEAFDNDQCIQQSLLPPICWPNSIINWNTTSFTLQPSWVDACSNWSTLINVPDNTTSIRNWSCSNSAGDVACSANKQWTCSPVGIPDTWFDWWYTNQPGTSTFDGCEVDSEWGYMWIFEELAEDQVNYPYQRLWSCDTWTWNPDDQLCQAYMQPECESDYSFWSIAYATQQAEGVWNEGDYSYGCEVGVYNDLADNGSNFFWECNIPGTSISTSCSHPRISDCTIFTWSYTSQPADASNGCINGTYTDIADDLPDYRQWECTDGWVTVTCQALNDQFPYDIYECNANWTWTQTAQECGTLTSPIPNSYLWDTICGDETPDNLLCNVCGDWSVDIWEVCDGSDVTNWSWCAVWETCSLTCDSCIATPCNELPNFWQTCTINTGTSCEIEGQRICNNAWWLECENQLNFTSTAEISNIEASVWNNDLDVDVQWFCEYTNTLGEYSTWNSTIWSNSLYQYLQFNLDVGWYLASFNLHTPWSLPINVNIWWSYPPYNGNDATFEANLLAAIQNYLNTNFWLTNWNDYTLTVEVTNGVARVIFQAKNNPLPWSWHGLDVGNTTYTYFDWLLNQTSTTVLSFTDWDSNIICSQTDLCGNAFSEDAEYVNPINVWASNYNEIVPVVLVNYTTNSTSSSCEYTISEESDVATPEVCDWIDNDCNWYVDEWCWCTIPYAYNFSPIATRDDDSCEYCGDWVTQSWDGEVCDDGNTDVTDSCLPTCEATFCGDGFTQDPPEQCDAGADYGDLICEENTCTRWNCDIIWDHEEYVLSIEYEDNEIFVDPDSYTADGYQVDVLRFTWNCLLTDTIAGTSTSVGTTDVWYRSHLDYSDSMFATWWSIFSVRLYQDDWNWVLTSADIDLSTCVFDGSDFAGYESCLQTKLNSEIIAVFPWSTHELIVKVWQWSQWVIVLIKWYLDHLPSSPRVWINKHDSYMHFTRDGSSQQSGLSWGGAWWYTRLRCSHAVCGEAIELSHYFDFWPTIWSNADTNFNFIWFAPDDYTTYVQYDNPYNPYEPYATCATCECESTSTEDVTCNGIDDDCDGSIDEDYAPINISCGAWVCLNTISTSCESGVEINDCAPLSGNAVTEICGDNIDNDCDGAVDEDFDIDGDGVLDCNDNCPDDANPLQEDENWYDDVAGTAWDVCEEYCGDGVIQADAWEECERDVDGDGAPTWPSDWCDPATCAIIPTNEECNELLDVVLLLDSSWSMTNSMWALQTSAVDFMTSLLGDPDNQWWVVFYNNAISSQLGLSTDLAALTNLINAESAWWWTQISAWLTEAINMLNAWNPSATKHIVIFTDGNIGDLSWAITIANGAWWSINISMIQFWNGVDASGLVQWDGEYISIDDFDVLYSAMTSIPSDLCGCGNEQLDLWEECDVSSAGQILYASWVNFPSGYQVWCNGFCELVNAGPECSGPSFVPWTGECNYGYQSTLPEDYCEAWYDWSCDYCNITCDIVAVSWPSCGDWHTDIWDEECDWWANCTACECDAWYSPDDEGNCLLNSCDTDTVPANATACNDGPDPSAPDVDNVLVATCDIAVECDYACDSWYIYDSGTDSCVAVECVDAAQCETNNGTPAVCTIWECQNAGTATADCVQVNAAVDTACGDTNGSVCDQADTCDGNGVCLDNYIASWTSCESDNDVCNGIQECDGAWSCGWWTPLVCDDGLFCNWGESCDAINGCQAWTPPSVDDGVSCTDDSCNETTDTIDHIANNANCDNGLFCDGSETCDLINDCQAWVVVTCDDGAFCNWVEICNETTDVCDAWTPVVCDDGLACSTDSCNETTDMCDFDNNACGCPTWDDDECDNGLRCDGTETCDTNTLLCINGTPVSCDNGEYCDGMETCDETADECAAWIPPSVDDGVSCTDDSCNETTDSIDHIANNANCDNGLFCDGSETCDLVNDCQAWVIVNCDDGLFCNGDETCNEVTDVCDAWTDVTCDDGLACSTDSCNEATDMCDFDGSACDCPDWLDSQCDNGLRCDGTETCDTNTLLCINGTPVSCDNGEYCDGGETCDETADECAAWTPPSIDDGVSCTDDSCNETTDTIDHVPNNANCDNGLYCDGSEICDLINDCQAGSNVICDDADACNGVETCNETTDSCDAWTPPEEICGNNIDDDCDGETDEWCNLCGNDIRDHPNSTDAWADTSGTVEEECDDTSDPNCDDTSCLCVNDTLPGWDGECYEVVDCVSIWVSFNINTFETDGILCNPDSIPPSQNYEFEITLNDLSTQTHTSTWNVWLFTDMSGVTSIDDILSYQCSLSGSDDVCGSWGWKWCSPTLNNLEYVVFNPYEYLWSIWNRCNLDAWLELYPDSISDLNIVNNMSWYSISRECWYDNGNLLEECSLDVVSNVLECTQI